MRYHHPLQTMNSSMSTCQRAYQREMLNFSKKFKLPLQNISAIMPIGFSDDDFLSAFKKCYAGLWYAIQDRKTIYDMMDAQRIKKHLPEAYHHPMPEDWFYSRAKAVIANTRIKHKASKILPDDERNALRDKLVQKCQKRQNEKLEQTETIEKYLQMVTPKYTNNFIKDYFTNRGQTQEDVDKRYQILLQASKYRCEATIAFMLKVNAMERNEHLRYFAFQTLQKKFGFPEVLFKRNHYSKGMPIKIEPHKIETPEALLAAITNEQFDSQKKYDVFLSHSSLDSELVLHLMSILNSKGLTVYVDWVEDQTALKRNLTSGDTAKVLIERIKSSRVILYVKTSQSALSLWTPWELGYAQAIGKKITVLEIEYIAGTPQYLDIYDKSKLMEDGTIMVDDQDEILPIEMWINK